MSDSLSLCELVAELEKRLAALFPEELRATILNRAQRTSPGRRPRNSKPDWTWVSSPWILNRT